MRTDNLAGPGGNRYAARVAGAVTVSIDALVFGGTPRSLGLDPLHVVALAETIDSLPPIVVHRPSMRILDGVHRVRAAQTHGRREIEARLFDGDDVEAFVVAVSENVTHGLPLPISDRKAAAQRLVAERPQWSDRRIASVTGLSARTVAAVRPTAGDLQLDTRVGRDGRARPLDHTRGRAAAIDFITDHPDASLRDIARNASISPETARDVRDRLGRGEDPTPVRERSRTNRSCPAGEVTIPVQRMDGVVLDATLSSLRRDPSLRLSEAGRSLLRLLGVNTMDSADWERLAGTIPQHCVERVAVVARECVQAWSAFVDGLERQGTVGWPAEQVFAVAERRAGS